MNITELPPLTPEQVGPIMYLQEPRPFVASLQTLLRAHIMTMYGWDLPDDPHGYAADYDRELQKMAAAFGIELPPSPNI